MTNQERQRARLPRWRSVVPLRRPVRHGAIDRSGHAHVGGRFPRVRWFFARYGHVLRRAAIGAGAVAVVMAVACLGLWWRLSSGPIQLDVVTPWLASAIEENFGNGRHVEVGGTQIERTENGGTAVRIRDIVVRDADGTIVASAPKAEVHVSGMSLLSGHVRAESLNLVGAEMAVRIEQDGGVTIFAGADKRPIATAAVPAAAATRSGRNEPERMAQAAAAALRAASPASVPSVEKLPPPRRASEMFAGLLSRIDAIGESGLGGHELRELGLKNGNLTVNDERTGKRWTFRDISMSVERARSGGVEVTIGSDNPERPWGLTGSIVPTGNGYRKIGLEARRVAASDLLLASRLGDGNAHIDIPLSASIDAVVGPDGVPDSLSGRIVAESGSIGDANEEDGRIAFDHAEFRLNWNAASRVLAIPFQILSGGNRITLMGQIEAPEEGA